MAVFPTAWLLDSKGLRLVCLIAAFLVFMACALRCFTTHGLACTLLAHTGQALNGLAGPVAMAAAPVLSATWFPLRERTTATAIMSMANNLGVALSFILGPLLVPQSNDYDAVAMHVCLLSFDHRSPPPHPLRSLSLYLSLRLSLCLYDCLYSLVCSLPCHQHLTVQLLVYM